MQTAPYSFWDSRFCGSRPYPISPRTRARPLIIDIFLETLDQEDANLREIGAHALLDISTVEPKVLKWYKEKIEEHIKDTNKKVAKCLRTVLENFDKPPTKHDYSII